MQHKFIRVQATLICSIEHTYKICRFMHVSTWIGISYDLTILYCIKYPR